MLVAKLYFETWANGYLRELILANQHLTETRPDKPDIFMRVNNSQEFCNYIDFDRIVTYKLLSDSSTNITPLNWSGNCHHATKQV